jgi:excinuclease ABC subunit C
MQTLRIALDIDGLLSRIEAYDISHLQGSDQTASMVVFQDGRPRPPLYRHFAVDEVAGADDIAALTSVVRRRLAHLQDAAFGTRPDLLLIDGGHLQVQTIVRLLAELDVGIPVAGLVKDDRHRTRGLVRQDGRIIELRRKPVSRQTQLVLKDAPVEEQSIMEQTGIASEDLSLLRLLTAIQNEAHRFAGQYRKKRTQKRQTRFSLERIPGIGPTRRRALLVHFSSIRAISEAEETAIAAIPGIGPVAARAVYQHFHQTRGE